MIVCESRAAVTWKVRVTDGAAAYVPLPACDAVIEQVPVATSVADEPETVHTDALFEANETARPLDAFADNTVGPWSTRVSDGCANAIVCESGAAVTWKVRVTESAAAYAPLPACDAVIEHVPTVSSITDEPDTVHTDPLFEPSETASPLDALADNETGP